MEPLRNVFMKHLVLLAHNNKNIVVLDCDMAKHNRLCYFENTFNNRFYQIGIAEQNAIGIAAGLAKSGKIPIVSSFASFICGRAWEQIRHSVAYNRCNVKIVATHAGLSAGEEGGTHQCVEDFALMMALPNVDVFAPAFPTECKTICQYVTTSNKPAYIRLGRDEVEVDTDDYSRIGDPIIFGSKTANIAIISTGEISQEICKIPRYHPNVKVLHLGCLRPINNEKIISALDGVTAIFVVEEHTKYGGLASILYMNGILGDKKVIPVNLNEHFGQTGTTYELREYFGLSNNRVLAAMRENVEGDNNVHILD